MENHPRSLQETGRQGELDISARLQQWFGEATNPEHPDHRHAELDRPASHYVQIQALVEKLRYDTESFDHDDVTELFGLLNSGQRNKNRVADENPLPVLRMALLELLDGDGRPADRIRTADAKLKRAGPAMLGELYGWVHAEQAPLFNQCAVDALTHLGYDVSMKDYDGFVAGHEQFKTIYEGKVSRLRDDIPLNLEIDKFYNVLDKVDLAPQKRLTNPLDEIFESRAAAEWTFDLFKFALIEAGCTGPKDERFALTIPKNDEDGPLMRINYGKTWFLNAMGNVDEFGPSIAIPVDLKNLDSDSDHYQTHGPNFSDIAEQLDGEHEFRMVYFQTSSETLNSERLRPALASACHAYKSTFGHWERCQFYQHHRQAIFDAIFDPAKRDELFSKDIPARDSGDNFEKDKRRYWRTTKLEQETHVLPNGETCTLHIWPECLERGLAVLGFGGDDQHYIPRKFMTIQPGDGIVGFQRNKRIGGIGVVTNGYDEALFKEQPEDQNYWDGLYWFRIGVDWQPIEVSTNALPEKTANKFKAPTLNELTEEEFYLIAELGGVNIDLNDHEAAPESNGYSQDDFLSQTHLTIDQATDLRELLIDKKQLILYGPPGTGKTFIAQHLARWLAESAAPSQAQVETVQFHPAYSYEDFMEGIRPETLESDVGAQMVHYPTRVGLFVAFCRQAASMPEKKHVFIIDEINRGNLPRILGELMMLLEYRDQTIPLPYSGDRFGIPDNVYIIGTMNTADRSIALVDFALRRRFHFFQLRADPVLFERWLAANEVTLPYLADLYGKLCQAIDDPNYAIGASHFMQPSMQEDQLKRVWRYSIIPYLEEYYIGQSAKIDPWRWESESVRQIRQNHG